MVSDQVGFNHSDKVHMLGVCFIGTIPSFDTNFKISNNVNSDQTPDLLLLSASFLCTFELLRDKTNTVTMIP